MENHQAYELLKNCRITSFTSVIDGGGDFNTGPRMVVTAKITSGGGLFLGELGMTLMLNEHAHRPILMYFDFAESGNSSVMWRSDTDDTSHDVMIEQLALRVIRLLAMRTLPGYTERTEALHEAFVNLADV